MSIEAIRPNEPRVANTAVEAGGMYSLLTDKRTNVLARRPDGRPIYPIGGGETDDDLGYKPNLLRRLGRSGDVVEQAIKDRASHIMDLRLREASFGRETSLAAVVARYGLEDPTDTEIAAAQQAKAK